MVFDFSLSPVKNSEGDVLHIVAEGRPMELYDGERGLSRYNLPAPFLLPPQTRSTARRVLPRAAPEVVSHLPGIVGESAAMKQVAAAVRAVASTAVPVLLLGEAGTGKDLVARAIHNLSCSSPGRFVKLSARSDFGALLSAEGSYGGLTVLLEEIGRGTLYLDKVDELPRELQAKLFRFLSEFIEKEQRSGRSVRFRWIFSAKPDLPRKALSGQFRNDLFNLLNACMIVIPPLRERREDISALVHFFAEKYVRRCRREIISISDETLAAFAQADWPVNVLQLEAAVADAVVRAQEARLPLPRLTNVLLPVCQSEPNAEPACERLEAVELQHILNILRQSQGRVSRAAMRLGIKRTTLNSRLRRLGITADTLRGLRQSARGH
jgi:formate hydrogenlyase transcriptional activator